MATAKIIIFCAIISVAVCFTIPAEQQIDDGLREISDIQAPLTEVVTRRVRSPDSEPKRTIEARGEHSSRHGANAGVTYTHPVGKNVDVYGGVSRNFRHNDNSGHVGVRYKF
ncbi:uncharacterized protein LOC129919063 [Episyrphus balteatus]|uniref:uncharacterized protein LOC129919063 n=1 Tax=Episyrphus balteatus TaxID=286459 RepID=UPI0024865DD6|nr:uncharacterized protein LOC129919063 [Episyrphus balteatus]